MLCQRRNVGRCHPASRVRPTSASENYRTARSLLHLVDRILPTNVAQGAMPYQTGETPTLAVDPSAKCLWSVSSGDPPARPGLDQHLLRPPVLGRRGPPDG